LSQIQAEVFTITEVANTKLRCSTRKVSELARELGVGMNLGGSAGWRFTDDDVAAMRQAMTPAPSTVPEERRRKRRDRRPR
jgi:hypothetical protein